MLKNLGFNVALLCPALLTACDAPTDTADNYDQNMKQSMEMRCWNEFTAEFDNVRLDPSGFYINGTPYDVDVRGERGVVIKYKIAVFESQVSYHFDDRERVIYEYLAEGETEDTLYAGLVANGTAHKFDEIMAGMGKRQVTKCD